MKLLVFGLGYSGLAVAQLSMADFCAAAFLSSLDFMGDVDWEVCPAAKDWYARIKSRPSFWAVLNDRVGGGDATAALWGFGFLVAAVPRA